MKDEVDWSDIFKYICNRKCGRNVYGILVLCYIKILKGESPKNIPVEEIKEVTLTVNEEAKKFFDLK